MEKIIQQKAVELVEEIVKITLSEKFFDIDRLSADVEAKCKATAKSIVESVAEELNQSIRQDKAGRKAQGLVLKEKNRVRKYHTKLGELEIKRDYYKDKTNDQYVAVLDQVLGIEKYERVGRTVSAEMVNWAADVSYAKSAEIAGGGKLSRQTVRNHILKLNVPEYKGDTARRKVKELHVYADEDHVHMQRPGKEKGKSSRIVPLVTVTEGTRKVSANRNETINKVHFVDENFSTKNLWKTVEGYIGKTYDMEVLEKIYLHGDGGNWITNGLENFAQKKHVMDGYHYGKALKKVTRRFPQQKIGQRIGEAVTQGDYSIAEELLSKLIQVTNDKDGLKCLNDFKTYLKNHWDAICALKNLDIPGSCTEAQVSHVLSERFSRDPLGWSDVGLGKLSCIRVYKENGKMIEPEHFDTQREETYADYAETVIRENVWGCFDWSIFDQKEFYPFNQSSGTQTMLRSLGREHSILWS